MKRLLTIVCTLLASQPMALAQDFKAGDRVFIKSTKEYGTVLSITKMHGSGGLCPEVRPDGRPQDAGPYNPSQLTPAGAGAPEAPVADGIPAPGGRSEAFKAGDRVFIKSTKEYGTVLSITKMHGSGGLCPEVRPDGRPQDAGSYNPSQLAHAGAGAPAAPAGAAPPGPIGNQASGQKTPNRQGGNNPGGDQAPHKDKLAIGRGMPPNGLYDCNKISGSSYIHLGTLEINGSTYRGINNDGQFHPFAMDGTGNLNFSAGLKGLRPGWTLVRENYAGLDEQGRPLIRIYYRSAPPNYAFEVMDAVIQKH